MDYCEEGLIRAALLKDLQSPAPRVLGNIEAELLIVSGQYILHYRDDHQQDQIKFLSQESVRQAFDEQEVISGWLPAGIRQWGINTKGTWMIQWLPPAKHTLTLLGKGMPEEAISVALPALIFAGIGTMYYVWASKEREFSPNLPLYQAPLPNVYADGKVCFGNNTPAPVSAETFQNVWQLFINSPFNADLAGGKSTRHKTDVRHQLCASRKKATYPVGDLVPFKRYSYENPLTLSDAVDHYFLQKNF
ncbi:hypothetical protein KDA_75940 [Dictyobacter alpinus]|uniref:PRTRC system protein B n=1 Tax=Dictyobacter alpinus TaxID=2014873 RepID=A0A402BLC2_9CHLR|nr:hypothetical protein [Dictyobacter alpinus]GCE32110.1 hypothetical protein KDA_75940 [Dictyobacter alpinus]